jgi:hypothetical protein
MGSFKSVFGVFGALLPVVYCGSLLYYFLDLSGSMDEAVTNGLGPTVVGLGAVGLLCCIPLLIKVVGLFSGARARGRASAPTQEPEGEFDADAVLARYMAKQANAAPAPERGAPAARTSFGRKIT